MEERKVLNRQKQLNQQVAEIFHAQGITKFRLTALGNSISSGFSFLRTIKPLLLRNESIQGIMQVQGIDYETFTFARAQNNCDEHINDWLNSNIKIAEIYRRNRADYGNSELSMREYPEAELDKHFPQNPENNVGLKDVVFESCDDLANVIVYNGATGSFLDIWTRNGKIKYHLMYGVNRDITSIQAILNQIQNNNRIGGANTQIYLCGAPDILGLKVTNLINSKLKRISKLYANTTYVPSVKAKGLYRRLPANKDEKIGWGVDIHHDELEYLKLNNNILEAIVQNYLANHALIELDRILFHLNNTNEFTNPAAKNSEIDPDILVLLYDKCYNVLGDEESQSIFNQRLREYLRERGPHDFFYVNYKTLTESPAKVYKHNY